MAEAMTERNTGNPPERQSQIKSDALLRTAVDAIITIDDGGIIKSANPAALEMFRYIEAELIGQNVSVLAPQPHRSNHDGYIGSYLRTGEKKVIGIGREVTGLRKDGTEFPIRLSVSEFYSGEKRYFTAFILDLTSRKQIENELKEQRALFQSIVDHVPDALFVCDSERIIVHYNLVAEAAFGYPPGELCGQSTCLLLASRHDFERLGKLMDDLASSGKTEPTTITCCRKDGSSFPGETLLSMVRNDDGEVTGYIALIRDITEEMKREEALRRAQHMEAIGQLTGGIAHDFNNLLTVITGNQELLEMRLEDDKNRDLLRRANEAAEMGARLTNRLLAFAKQNRLEPSAVELNGLILDTMELLRGALGETIDLTSVLAPDLWQTKTDASKLENTLLNLAINARDAIPTNGRLVIETANARIDDKAAEADTQLQPGDYVRMSVSDNGEGMSADVLARAFEPFYTTKQTGRGTGLGLSTIYGFVKQSGGHITIYSEPGQGTTVNLYLPRYDGAGGQKNTAPHKAALGGPVCETILIVEDNDAVRELTLERLQQLGYNVLEADGGASALEIIRSDQEIDLVFSDIVMAGGMSGYDLADWIHTNKPDLGILLTSGFAEQLAREQKGANAELPILRKPYSQAELAQAVRETIAAAPKPDQARRTSAANK